MKQIPPHHEDYTSVHLAEDPTGLGVAVVSVGVVVTVHPMLVSKSIVAAKGLFHQAT